MGEHKQTIKCKKSILAVSVEMLFLPVSVRFGSYSVFFGVWKLRICLFFFQIWKIGI